MTRDGRRPPTTRYGWIRLEHRTDAGKPPADPPTGPKDGRPPRGPVQPSRPHPQDPDKLPDPRPARAGQDPPYPPGSPSPGPGPTGPGPGGPRPGGPGRLIYTIAGVLLLARHRNPEPAGEPLGHRRDRPHHPDGWTVPRDQPAEPAWPGGKRPPLRTNIDTPKETPR